MIIILLYFPKSLSKSLSFYISCDLLGISRDNYHKRRATGGRKKPLSKKRKYSLGRPAANTKVFKKNFIIYIYSIDINIIFDIIIFFGKAFTLISDWIKKN